MITFSLAYFDFTLTVVELVTFFLLFLLFLALFGIFSGVDFQVGRPVGETSIVLCVPYHFFILPFFIFKKVLISNFAG